MFCDKLDEESCERCIGKQSELVGGLTREMELSTEGAVFRK